MTVAGSGTGTRVLVTGHRGMIGRAVVAALAASGQEIVGFDRADDPVCDLRDVRSLAASMSGCDAVIHLAGIDQPHAEADVLVTNLLGARNVLGVAENSGVERVVVASSVNALGVFKGEAPPAYLPIDDDHPAKPTTGYGLSKLAIEALCRGTSERGGPVTICLRPPGVATDDMRARLRAARAERPSLEWDPVWEYSAWIHVDDVAAAFVAALSCPVPQDRHATMLVASADVSSDHFGGHELARRVLPEIPWRGGPEHDVEPRRSLLRTERAQALLAWHPQRTWLDG